MRSSTVKDANCSRAPRSSAALDTLALTQATPRSRMRRPPTFARSRLVFVARALERNNMFDSAAATYARAARSASPGRAIGCCCAPREARATRRNARKRSQPSRLAAAKARVAMDGRTGARTIRRRPRRRGALCVARRDRSGASAWAVRRARLGARATPFEDELLAFIRSHNGSGDAKTAVEVLDKAFTSLSPAEELIIARSAAIAGRRLVR